MPRYIFISFLFMGWAFFELSGGTDFAPPERADTATAAVAAPAAKPRTAIERARQARASQAVTLAAAPANTPEPRASARTPARTLVINAGNIRQAETDAKLDQVRASLRQGLGAMSDSADRQVKIVSLSPAPPKPIETAAAPVRAPVEASADLREIVATRVNMRAGPGTDHDILDRLTRGQTVEVLGDNGQGWLRLRTLPGDRVGWIAARLVSPAS